MKTVRIKIDVYAGILFMEFGDITVYFNIFDVMKRSSEDFSVFRVEIIDYVVDEYMIDFYFNLYVFYFLCRLE